MTISSPTLGLLSCLVLGAPACAVPSEDPGSDATPGGLTPDGGSPPDARPPIGGADASNAPDAAPPRRPKVLLVGLDGVRFDTLSALSIPALRALAARGLFSRTWIYANPMAPTLSGPGWSTIATGVWPDKHRVRDNQLTGHAFAIYPDFLTRIETAAPALHTYVIADWPQIDDAAAPGPIFGAAADLRVSYNGDSYPGGWVAADAQVAREAAARLRTEDPDAAFVYLGNPDEVAHSSGTGAGYRAAIETADQQVAALLAAVEARPTYGSEDWVVIVVTDHGHRDGGGHGGPTWQERQTWVIAAGGGVPRTTLTVQPRLVDVVPTILAHLGIAVDPRWGLDGLPLATPTTDPFDALVGHLGPAQDETTIPPTILGWTHEPPSGWSIDNARMTSGGTTEWRGWSFVDEAFWTETDIGQGREAFVRSRGVIAVADPDEWDDVGAASQRGTFDSTLVSSPYSVAGRTSVRLRFGSHYRQDGVQKGQVLVAFDGGAESIALRYGPDASAANAGGDVISQIESLELPVPRGAAMLVVRWRLFDARNDWFWAIDDPRVE